MTDRNAWHKDRIVAFDLETTGSDPETARIVTASIITLGPGGRGDYHWLADPGVEIPEAATAIHGITTECAQAEGHPAEQVAFELLAILAPTLGKGIPVVAFNAAFDFTVLDREALRHNVDTLTQRGTTAPIVDPYVIDKHIDPYRKGSRKLTDTANHYGIRLDHAHDATADAYAAARIAYELTERHPDILQIPLAALHEQQQVWRRDQALSLQEYFRRSNPDATVNPDWPIHRRLPNWRPDTVDQEQQAVAS